MNKLKKIILNSFRYFGYNIKKLQKEEKNFLNFDEIYQKILKNKKVTIFDVGANRGQSINRFLKIFPNAEIHCFEPIKNNFLFLRENFKYRNIKLNNFALGEKNEVKRFYINAKSSTSSFNKLTKNTGWLKLRSKESNKKMSSFTIESKKIIVNSLDYCKKNKIKKIDILKIDTQGFEDKILLGSKNSLNNNIISIVELEMIFDDVYKKYSTFTDIEKNLLKNDYRFAGIETCNNNLFEGILFFGDLIYMKKNIIKKHLKK